MLVVTNIIHYTIIIIKSQCFIRENIFLLQSYHAKIYSVTIQLKVYITYVL